MSHFQIPFQLFTSFDSCTEIDRRAHPVAVLGCWRTTARWRLGRLDVCGLAVRSSTVLEPEVPRPACACRQGGPS